MLDRPGLEPRSYECYRVAETGFDRLSPYREVAFRAPFSLRQSGGAEYLCALARRRGHRTAVPSRQTRWVRPQVHRQHRAT
jgi:hypothetical protein